jgi:signal recognition particle subunit SRP72
VVAAYISAGRGHEVPALLTTLGLSADECFEAAYNIGCAKLAQGQLAEAHELLLLSNRMGREALLDEEYAEEDIEKELLPSVWGLRRCVPVRLC